MISLKKLPNSERPYEKLEIYGEKALSNSELLAIILKTGTKEQTAVGLAQNILTICGNNNIRELQEISLIELKKIKGIGRVKAIQIKAMCELAKRMARPLNMNIKIREPKDVASLLMQELRYEKKEIIKILILNTKNVIQKIVDISSGNISSVNVEPRQILEEILKTGMSKFILVHNHPSGDVTPSYRDYDFTEKLRQAAKIIGLEFLDHIIIGDGIYQSIFVNLEKRRKEETGQ